MNSATLNFQIVSPEKLLFDDEVSMVVLPAAKGEMGVLPNHAPMIVTLNSGVIDVYQNGKVMGKIFVGGGFANVYEDGCTVMADESIYLKDIKPEMVEKHIEKTMQKIEATEEGLELEALEGDLTIARAKMEIWQRLSQMNKIKGL